MTLKLKNNINYLNDEGTDIIFYNLNPNIEMVIKEDEESKYSKTYTFNIFDYDANKVVCKYDIKFGLHRKRITSTCVELYYNHDDNQISLRQHTRLSYNVFNYDNKNLLTFINRVKSNKSDSLHLFMSEGRYILYLDYDSENNNMKFINVITGKTDSKETTVTFELSLLNPLVKHNILHQFENLYNQLNEYEAILKKKK